MEYIEKNHGSFILKFRSMKAPLDEIFTEEEVKKERREIDRGMIGDIYEKLLAAAEAMDIDSLESILKEMDAYSFPEDQTELLNRIKEASGRYDYDTITELLSKE